MHAGRSIIYLFFTLLLGFPYCKKNEETSTRPVKIAFISDVHLQDIYAGFPDTDYRGVKNPATGKYNTVRTMDAQLHSTRIFNENYFAFLAALNDVVKKGIKYVMLTGDFSDNGQPMNVKALSKILHRYGKRNGIRFLAITGNHDPVKPFAQEASKTDFLGKGGKEQTIASTKTLLQSPKIGQLKPIITSAIQKWGYKGILKELSDFGFFPKKDFLYWETPFSSYNYTDYSYEKADRESALTLRTYRIPGTDQTVPDASYLVEPVKDVWLLALDGNVYVPKKDIPEGSQNPNDYGSASTGYNNVLKYKKHLIDWVKRVSAAAKKRNKTLIAFSHYPMVEFNDGASEEMKALFGKDKMQLNRVPKPEVAEAFADAGLKIHFGGHMHINDTGIGKSKKGNTLVNVQIPSLAAYLPAYKILTIRAKDQLEIETPVLDSVPDFNELFPLYEEEHNYLQQKGDSIVWDEKILGSKTYAEFTAWHLRELVRLRFLPEDWPKTFKDSLLAATGRDLLFMDADKKSTASIKKTLSDNGLSLSDFDKWTGFDMVYDFYRLHSADELAKPEIGKNRLKQYALFCETLADSQNPNFKLWAETFQRTSEGLPSDHFMIDLSTNTLKRINLNGKNIMSIAE